VTRALTVGSYAVLGSLLAWSRLAGLNRAFCCDEIYTVTDYVRAGPSTILTGSYTPNNHELFSLLGWTTSSLFGESALALRLGSAVPFIVGVVVVTAWLHVRAGTLAAVLFLGFATFSPLLIDLSRFGRGYGLTFGAMSLMIVAALEADRNDRTSYVVAFCVAGVVGALTLPHFAITFAATSIALSIRPSVRTRCILGTAFSLIVIAIWYAPHFDDIASSSTQDYGTRIALKWLLTSPFDQILLPGIGSLDETLVRPSIGSLVAATAFAVLVASSPLLRQRSTLLILCSGVAATVLAFWITDTRVVPRFLSFLLVPLFMLLATGIAFVLSRLRSRPAPVRTVVALVVLGVLVFVSLPLLADVTRLPRDSPNLAAEAIRLHAPRTTQVYAYMRYPTDLAFYLGRPVHDLSDAAGAGRICDAPATTVLVEQTWLMPGMVTVPCLERAGTRHYRFEQYARGGAIDAWIIPERQ
jgi:hypothetical protein